MCLELSFYLTNGPHRLTIYKSAGESWTTLHVWQNLELASQWKSATIDINFSDTQRVGRVIEYVKVVRIQKYSVPFEIIQVEL